MFKVRIEEYPGIYIDKAECATFDDAFKRMGELYDEGFDDDFLVVDTDTGGSWPVSSYKLMKEACPECGSHVRRMDMFQTRDCHGIPFRYVCMKCYNRIMNCKGYDGQRYSDADEQIEPDW